MQQGDEQWRERAACRGTDVHLWFPAPSAREASPPEQQRVRDAKAICADCSVRAECLAYALERTIWHGVWGGKTESERRSLVRNRRDLKRKRRQVQV